MELFKIDNNPHRPFYIIYDEAFGLLQIYYDMCFDYWMFFYCGNTTETHLHWDKKIPISDLELLVLFDITLNDISGVLKYMELLRSRETRIIRSREMRITAKVETALWWARHQK